MVAIDFYSIEKYYEKSMAVIKGTVHSKINILSLITHPHVVPNL